LVFYHDKENKYPFTLQDESDGTLRIFDLAEVLLANPDNKVFIIDELDRCLHPSLTLQFIRLFLKEASCPTFTNQLIVTTHESRLMDLDILRRDEIWFTKKDKGISSLYSLEDYNERFDKVIDKAYLNGRYGGIPVFDSVFLPECLKK
jgi:AAA15 family ATPase/GTPase